MSEHRHHGSWAVWLNDTDREPEGWTRLDVRPSNGAHITEEDAEWLRQLIRAALDETSPRTAPPCLCRFTHEGWINTMCPRHRGDDER